MKRPRKSRWLLSVVLAGMAASCPAQSVQPSTQPLLDKAHMLEARGRLDMAAQAWNQVLLADPDNAEALAGLARAARSSGETAKAQRYLDRLRAVDPHDPAIARIEAMSTQREHIAQLQQAARLAQQGQYAQAMTIYRQAYGSAPPPGDAALAYYETESATEDGRAHAIEGLRTLAARYPSDGRYAIALGRILTYNPKTRAEGRRVLAKYPNDPSAVQAYGQSLLFDVQNPQVAPEIRAFLSRHRDPQLQAAFVAQTRAVPQSAGLYSVPALSLHKRALEAARHTRVVENRAAYRALNAHDLLEAESRFQAILNAAPQDPDALAGMGYVRMQQDKFSAALSYFAQAREDGSRDRGLESAMATSRFWETMKEGALAAGSNDLSAAERNYRAALTIRPDSPEALEALGGTLLKAGQPAAAQPFFMQLTRMQPLDPHAWRELFLAQAGAGQAMEALSTEQQQPAAVRAALARDPLYLRELAAAYTATGQDAEAHAVLEQALNLPFPADPATLEADKQLQYAGLFQAAGHLDQAAGLYRQVLARDPANTPAWEGLVLTQHLLNQDPQALTSIQTMPQASFARAMQDPGFDQTLAAIYQSQGRLDASQQVLEKALAQQATAGQQPSPAVQVQLAGLYQQREDPQQAYVLYRRVLTEKPSDAGAWKGLLSSLHQTHRDADALAEVRQIPGGTRAQLENDPAYLQTIASVYEALGQPVAAEPFLSRVQQHYAALRTAPPASVEIQQAWLLYNGDNEPALYGQLLALSQRNDLTPSELRTVQLLWINLAVRRAKEATRRGDRRGALLILNTATQAFPDNPSLPPLLAAAYSYAGADRQAVGIWRAQDLSAAPAADYRAAVGAALAAKDTKDAATWLRLGLVKYPRDSQLLALAAKFEQARGDASRAIAFYHEALAAAPSSGPSAGLAGEPGRPGPISAQPVTQARRLQDLAELLQPGPASAGRSMQPADESFAPLYLSGSGGGNVPVQLQEQVQPYPPPAPSGAPPSNPKQEPGQAQPALRDFVPHAALPSVPLLRPAPLVQAARLVQERPIRVTSAVYFPKPVPRITAEPQDSNPAASGPAFQTVAWQQIQQGQSGQPAQSSQNKPASSEIYGPYVPYKPSSAAQVQLGNQNPVPHPATQPEGTDALPRARYLPNAHTASTSTASRHESIAGRTGLSQPPSETITATPADSVEYKPYVPYTGPPQSHGGVQVSQPAASGQAPDTSLPQAGSRASFGQQYPQPDTPSRPSRRRARAVRRVAPVAPAPAAPSQVQSAAPPPATLPAPVPAYQGMNYPSIQPPGYQPYPVIGPVYSLGTPSSNYDLTQQSLPPLRERYYTGNLTAPQVPLTEREQLQRDLAALEGSYSGWLGGTASARYRSGTPGVDRLTDLEPSVEASAMAGNQVRFTLVPRAVFLNSGTLVPVSSNTAPVLGTLSGNAAYVPPQQFVSGLGGEFQVATRSFAGAVGYTPYNFLVHNITGRLLFHAGPHVSFFGDRSPVVETQLSYAGLRDPGSASPVYAGNIWGGVVSTGGGLRLDLGNERAGFYLSAAGAGLSGYHVLDNNKVQGTMGAYFLAHTFPGYGRLNVGASLFGMHFAHNERPLTYGLGGYFSPDIYFLASVPVTFAGRYGDRFHYTLQGSFGVQTFQEDSQAYYPLDPGLQSAFFCTSLQLTNGTCGRVAANSSTGGNYSFNSEGAYRFADNWYLGGFLSANNSNNYNTVTGGFFVRYLFRPQVDVDGYPTGLFPADGFRPYRVP